MKQPEEGDTVEINHPYTGEAVVGVVVNVLSTQLVVEVRGLKLFVFKNEKITIKSEIK